MTVPAPRRPADNHPVQHMVRVAKIGDGTYAARGWRARCAHCRGWWYLTLDDWALTVKAADIHARTGVWP